MAVLVLERGLTTCKAWLCLAAIMDTPAATTRAITATLLVVEVALVQRGRRNHQTLLVALVEQVSHLLCRGLL